MCDGMIEKTDSSKWLYDREDNRWWYNKENCVDTGDSMIEKNVDTEDGMIVDRLPTRDGTLEKTVFLQVVV